MGEPDDKWEIRAVAIAVRLNQAADELRRIVDEYRRTREEPSDGES